MDEPTRTFIGGWILGVLAGMGISAIVYTATNDIQHMGKDRAMSIRERIIDALDDADSKGQLPVVAAVMEISEDRLRAIMATSTMSHTEEAILKLHLEDQP